MNKLNQELTSEQHYELQEKLYKIIDSEMFYRQKDSLKTKKLVKKIINCKLKNKDDVMNFIDIMEEHIEQNEYKIEEHKIYLYSI